MIKVGGAGSFWSFEGESGEPFTSLSWIWRINRSSVPKDSGHEGHLRRPFLTLVVEVVMKVEEVVVAVVVDVWLMWTVGLVG